MNEGSSSRKDEQEGIGALPTPPVSGPPAKEDVQPEAEKLDAAGADAGPDTVTGQPPEIKRDQPPPGSEVARPELAPPPPLPAQPLAMPAANDPVAKAAPPMGSVADLNLEILSNAWRAASDPPPGLPGLDRAELGKLTAVRALVQTGSVPQSLVDNIIRVKEEHPSIEAPGTTVVPMARLTGAHLLHALAIEIGARAELGKPLDLDLLSIYAAWLVRRMLEPAWMPPGQTIARLRAALIRPDGRTATGWKEKGRRRAVGNACHALQKAISASRLAAAVGLAVTPGRKPLATDPVSVSTRSFRRRVNNLKDFASKNNVAGATGYGTLSRNGLRHEGGRLLDRVKTGDAIAAHISLQVVTHLPSETMQKAVVINGGSPLPGADAWLDIAARTFSVSVQPSHLVCP